jgi:hypothetical protein
VKQVKIALLLKIWTILNGLAVKAAQTMDLTWSYAKSNSGDDLQEKIVHLNESQEN